jgi:hypothetical protein
MPARAGRSRCWRGAVHSRGLQRRARCRRAGPGSCVIPRRKEIMQMVAPSGPVYQAGTLSGNPLAMVAGIKTLEILDRPGTPGPPPMPGPPPPTPGPAPSRAWRPGAGGPAAAWVSACRQAAIASTLLWPLHACRPVRVPGQDHRQADQRNPGRGQGDWARHVRQPHLRHVWLLLL